MYMRPTPLSVSHCLVYRTVQDGYQRTWSHEGKILGEFALPNASEYQLRHRQGYGTDTATSRVSLFPDEQ